MLRRLELIGFKSFADKTRFEFAPGVTAIVGPNGSGKSNVVDAVKWVLGEQSAKSLRGGDMTDVIFNGSSTRKSLGLAEVTLTFDNGKRLLNCDVDEVQIARRVYRDGQSEYLVNGQLARLKDIKELFLGTGAGHGAYSVIEQGRVDALLTASTKDRRIIFERQGVLRLVIVRGFVVQNQIRPEMPETSPITLNTVRIAWGLLCSRGWIPAGGMSRPTVDESAATSVDNRLYRDDRSCDGRISLHASLEPCGCD